MRLERHLGLRHASGLRSQRASVPVGGAGVEASAEQGISMEIPHPGALWLIPVFLSVVFLLWVLYSFWKDEHR